MLREAADGRKIHRLLFLFPDRALVASYHFPNRQAD